MSESFSAEFYASNDGTQYPFAGVSDDFSRPFVDAQVSVPVGYDNHDVVLTQWDPAGNLEIMSGTTIIIPLDTPVATFVFGAYRVWEARTAEASATFVFVDKSPPPNMSGSYVLQERAVTRGGSKEIYVSVGSSEVAGPGELLKLRVGSNMTLTTVMTPSGPEITIGAKFSAADGCSQVDISRPSVLRSINGLGPDANGNFTITGSGSYLVEKLM